MSSISKATSYRDNQKDWGYPILCAMNESNGPDFINEDTGYDWLSGESVYDDRNDNSWHAALPWFYFYRQIKQANDLINTIGENPEDELFQQYLGMAYAIRAFDYISLASHYQFKYVGNEDAPSVPLVLHDTPIEKLNNNPRASQRTVYAQIIADCDRAIELLEGKSRSRASEPDQAVAYGLRARANLLMENWEKAAADAKQAYMLTDASAYSIDDVSQPNFIDASTWMWGIIYTPDMVVDNLVSWPGHMSSFSGYGYNQVGVFKRINRLLYDQISYTDVRKGWWLDKDKHTPNLDGGVWRGIPALEFLVKRFKAPSYSQVKFGQYGGYGGLPNAGDWALMRVEEMMLIEAEAKGHINEAEGKQLLQDFVKKYRDPSYDVNASPRNFFDEVWFQRRVELWGEGFSLFDIIRLGKPMVRTHGESDNDYFSGNYAPLQFNIAANDPILLNKIVRDERDTNPAVEQQKESAAPVAGQNSELRDGVTDFPPVSNPSTNPVTPTTYAITIATGIENGTVSVNPTEAAVGAEVVITVSAADGYQLKAGTLKAYKKSEPATEVSINAENKFTMPSYEVEVTAEFEAVAP